MKTLLFILLTISSFTASANDLFATRNNEDGCMVWVSCDDDFHGEFTCSVRMDIPQKKDAGTSLSIEIGGSPRNISNIIGGTRIEIEKVDGEKKANLEYSVYEDEGDATITYKNDLIKTQYRCKNLKKLK